MQDQNQKKTVYVIGHKNPDTDAVCAAISYAFLKNQTDRSACFVPKKAGQLNSETAYVLKRFGVEEPETVSDVSTQLRDIDFRHTAGVDGHYSLRKAWEHMQKLDVVTLPVVNQGGFLEGIIVNGDIAKSYMNVLDNRILGQSRTQYRNIIETLRGQLVTGNEHGFFTNGKVVVASGSHQTMVDEIAKDDLVILGDVKERQMTALGEEPHCMIITNAVPEQLDLEVIERARALECVLITTEYDTFTAARLIHQSMPIRYFMTRKNLVTFGLTDTVDEVQEAVSKIRHRDFPVLDDQHRYVGMFSRRNLLNARKKQVILVDHNERSQAVDGIDEAEILEIIDHHRLGSLETIQPIFFRNMPLGCTNTIIWMMYREKGVEISPALAGIMLSAILSDTLLFRSPTCTDTDRQAAEDLAAIAGVDMKELAVAMFEAGADFRSKTPAEIFYTDYKTFYSGDTSFGVSQISAVSRQQLDSIRDGIRAFLPKVRAERNLSMVFCMLTDIFEETTDLLFDGGNAAELVRAAFPEGSVTEDGAVRLMNVVSRKKQLVPPIIEAMQRQAG